MKLPKLSNISVDGSTVGDLYFPQTKLLLPFDGSNGATTTSDLSNDNRSITLNSSVELSSSQSKFGGTSLYVPGSSNACQIGGNLSLDGDFTIEFWEYIDTRYNDSISIGLNATSTNYAYHSIKYGYYNGGTKIKLYSSSNGSSWNIASGLEVGDQLDDQWVHRALVRSGSNWYSFQNGTQYWTATLGNTALTTSNQYHWIGRGYNSTSNRTNQGYYDDVRITLGQARYTSSFTAPTTAHLTSAGDVNKHIVVNSDADGVAIGTGGINQSRIAKAWANIDGGQTAASMIQSSYNISSMTDHGTGIYSFNFSTAMTDAHYTVTTGIGHIVDGAVSIPELLIQNQTAALVKLNARYSAGANTQANYDYNTCCMTVFGN
jgi:hypothetical protein